MQDQRRGVQVQLGVDVGRCQVEFLELGQRPGKQIGGFDWLDLRLLDLHAPTGQ